MAQPYQQMPGSAGGYGRGGQPAQQQWGQPQPGNFGQVNNGFGGYQG
jgi:nucleolysin TIA-1/TIAR